MGLSPEFTVNHMKNTRKQVLAHVAAVAVLTLALLVFAGAWQSAQMVVAVLGISAGVLTLQIMWNEFWHGADADQRHI